MAVVHKIEQYLEGPYLEDKYLISQGSGFLGMQSLFQINATTAVGQQTRFQIVDFQNVFGLQSEFNIIDFVNLNAQQSLFIINVELPAGMQVLKELVGIFDSQGIQVDFEIESKTAAGLQAYFVVNTSQPTAMQVLGNIIDFKKPTAMQAQFQIVDTTKTHGMEVRSDRFPNKQCPGEGYLESAYLESPYLTPIWCAKPGMQTRFQVANALKEIGVQSEFRIVDATEKLGVQTRFEIVDFFKNIGLQFEAQTVENVGLQFLSTIYNTTNLRILCDFPSRGVSPSNWTANSVATGDFSAENLDTDIVEQVWRSADSVVTGIQLTTDTGLPQGVFLDTLAILNHNMTRSANIQLIGSNDPTFSTVGTIIPLQSREENIYYIAPALPTSGFRYWRISIDDSTNPNGFVEIGVIVFGASQIFQGECFVDEIDFELRDYADTVNTEGFTNVANSRTQKRRVRLDFRSLDSNRNNFKTLRSIFTTSRTVLKCLWIPTPDPNDQEVTAKFAVFGKLSQIPVERHNNKGPRSDYASLSVDVDEAN